VLLSPRGRVFDQETARRYRHKEHLVLICGRYKDVDDRVRTDLVHEETSIGDFVLAGGEAAAVAIVESVARLFPESVEHPESVETDSFSGRLLDAPYYTRPRRYREMDVPEELISGDHAAVARWRRRQSLLCTARRRPGLLGDEALDLDERRFLQRHLNKETNYGQEEED
jgi:tRNA (guanine37-N1)-methyltransferase